MKLLALLALLSLSAYADDDISKFTGHTYKKAEYDLCLRDYDTITKNISSVDGLTVLAGGCLEYGRDNFRIEFDYIHPLATEVENYIVTFADETACPKFIKQAEQELLASGNHFVASYCEGKDLNTLFVDTTRSIVRSLNKLGKFNSQIECLNFIADLTTKAKANKMTSFLSYCQDTKYDSTAKIYFTPVFNYISYFEIEMGLINGKTVATQSTCADNRVNVEQNFSSNDIKIVYDYCAGAMTIDQNLQEIILYLKPKNARYIVEYEGVAAKSQEACEIQLNSIINGLENAGQKVLYGYCKKINDKNFKPSISYLKTIEL